MLFVQRRPDADWGVHSAAVDGKAHARNVGGDKFTIQIVGPFQVGASPAVIKDNRDGTYQVTWVTHTSGDYLVTAMLEGYPVGGCPACCTGAYSQGCWNALLCAYLLSME